MLIRIFCSGQFAPIGLVGLFSLIASCSSPPPPPPSLPDGALRRIRALMGQEESKTFLEEWTSSRDVEIWFASNREQEGIFPSGSLSFGKTRVQVPDERGVGMLPTRVGDRVPLSLEEWKLQLGGASEWGVLVFTHGFNVRFEEALQRAAQLAFDLKFQGKVLLLSWPAGGNGGFLAQTLINRTYELNRKHALASIEPTVQVLRELASLWVPIQWMVHSMGHEVVLPALSRFAPEAGRVVVQELILNAPDFDPEEFVRILPALKSISGRVTLYCSDKDHAMTASKKVNHQERLGSCFRQEGVDVVNVSEVDDPGLTGLGHGYYASRSVLTDVRQVLFGIGAKQRVFIRKAQEGARSDYVLRR